MADRVTESSDAAWPDEGWAAWSRAVRVTGTLAGEARWSAVPWAKAKPVIAPLVPRLTRAVACCHQGLRGDGTVSPSFAGGADLSRAGTIRPPRARRPDVPVGDAELGGRATRPAGRDSEPGRREVLQDQLDLAVAGVTRVLEQDLRRLGLLSRGPHCPLLPDVPDQGRLLLGGAHRLGADVGEA